MSDTPSINLKDKIWVVVGPPDSGKTTLVKWLLSQNEYRRHLVYDPLYGFDPDKFHVIRPPTKETKYRRYEEGNPELNRAVDKFVLVDKEKRPELFVVDEAGRLLPNGKPEGGAMGDINDFNAHYDLSFGMIGQRLAQLNSDLENKATRYFVTGFAGKNDRAALKDVHTKLPDYVEAQEKYGFSYVNIDTNSVWNFKAVPEVGSKVKF